MYVQKLITRLETTSAAFPNLLKNVSESDGHWKPTADDWSIVEIVCHLADEDADDFRKRIELTLQDPSTEWPPIDPPQTAVDRKYNEVTLKDAIQRFVSERKRSLVWLDSHASQIEAELENTYKHPVHGPFRLGDLLGSWVAHDQLHLRQLTKRFYQLTCRDAEPYSTRYAGDW